MAQQAPMQQDIAEQQTAEVQLQQAQRETEISLNELFSALQEIEQVESGSAIQEVSTLSDDLAGIMAGFMGLSVENGSSSSSSSSSSGGSAYGGRRHHRRRAHTKRRHGNKKRRHTKRR